MKRRGEERRERGEATLEKRRGRGRRDASCGRAVPPSPALGRGQGALGAGERDGTPAPIHPRSLSSLSILHIHLQTFALALALILSAGSPKPSTVFSLVFGVCAAGAVVLTANVGLLGGNIGFFQSLCLLGYCLFPLAASAGAASLIPLPPARWAAVAVGLGWSTWAALPFIGGSVPPARRALAVYPLLLLYATLAWLAVVK